MKDRFKGLRTKYYVLKAFAATTEVFLTLLEEAQGGTPTSGSLMGSLTRRPSDAPPPPSRKRSVFASISTNMRRRSGASVPGPPATAAGQSIDEATLLHDHTMLKGLALEWIEKIDAFGSIYPVARPRALLLRGRCFNRAIA